MKKILLASLFFLNWTLLFSQELKPISLDEMYKLSEANPQELDPLFFTEEITKEKITAINGEFGPRINFLTGVGPVKGVRGTPLTSTSTDEYGESLLFKVDIKIPLYTWGRKDDLLKAVANKREIDKIAMKKSKLDFHTKMAETYWGYLLFKTLLDFAQSSKKDVEKILEKRNDDNYRLLLLMEEIKIKEAELLAKKETLLAGFNFLLGEKKPKYIASDEWLIRSKVPVKPFAFYQKFMSSNGLQDLRMLKNGIEAKAHLIVAEKKSQYPQLGLLAGFTYTRTPKYTDQQSSFAYDPYNKKEGVLGVGFTWDLDFGITKSKIQTLELEKRQLELQENQAEIGLEAKFIELFNEAKEKNNKIAHTLESLKIAKRWYQKKVIKFALGTNRAGEDKEIVDAYSAKALAFVAYYKSLYEEHIAIEKLHGFLNFSDEIKQH